MRYAIVSDLHANWQAWNAVLTDIRSMGVDRIICLGDTVGYGPNPLAVLESVHRNVHHLVLGNHDAVVAGKLDATCFNARARAAVQWTCAQLGRSATTFLRSLPYVLQGSQFRCSHAHPVCPERFDYILDDEAARHAWQACPEQVVFTGHSHIPGLYVIGASQTPHWLDPRDFSLESGKRYIINVGSVGHPRGHDVRATYVLFDHDLGDVRFRQIPFDLDAFRAALNRSSLPVKDMHVLSTAQALAPAPIRRKQDFRPPSPQSIPRHRGAVVRLETSTPGIHRRRLAAASLLLSLLVIAAGIYLHGARTRRRSLSARTISKSVSPHPAPAHPAPAHPAPAQDVPTHPAPAQDVPTHPASTQAAAETMVFTGPESDRALPLPSQDAPCLPDLQPVGRVGIDNLLPGWSVALESTSEQTLQVNPLQLVPDRHGVTSVLCLESDNVRRFEITSAPVTVEPGTRFQVQARCRGHVNAGHVELCLRQRLPDGTEQTLLHYPLQRLDPKRWKYTRKSTERDGLPQGGHVTWVLQGNFSGRLELHSCNLKRIK